MGSSYSNSLTLVCRSKAIFKSPSEEDLGIYSCFVTHTDGASASYTLSEEGEFIDLFIFKYVWIDQVSAGYWFWSFLSVPRSSKRAPEDQPRPQIPQWVNTWNNSFTFDCDSVSTCSILYTLAYY